MTNTNKRIVKTQEERKNIGHKNMRFGKISENNR